MKLYFWEYMDITNFGDQLNPWIWHQLIPEFLDKDSKDIFLGIGTVLGKKFLPNAENYIVMGSGAGYDAYPEINDSWKIYALRGPYTAKCLDLPLSLAITDPAILVADLFKPKELFNKKNSFSFMPHWSHAHAAWEECCNQLNFGYINPLSSVNSILEAISQTEILITSALHGAIVADALRIPWIPLKPKLKSFLPFKWQDWCASLDITYNPSILYNLWSPLEHNIKLSHGIKMFTKNQIKKWFGGVFQARSIFNLEKVSINAKPQLSEDHIFAANLERMNLAIERFRRDFS